MKQYDWSEAITLTLIDSITALHKTPEKVTRCVIALLYWLCEHANIIDSEDSNTTDFPRCAKWNLQSLTKQLQKTPIHSLIPRQNLKAKERKEKQQDPEFQCPKVAKVTGGSKQAAKQTVQTTKDKEYLMPMSTSCLNQQASENLRFFHKLYQFQNW
ncbi:uncharacterized protein LOC114286519 [Camellia sinensis]|uniref:uncharacterized protein LOC114286519 n=1 Tax=Camellia sinensis TaxID=4442 RepID=UPI0010360E65|nr:uncharacterized protein LOC114286519 [Camellia sinensis]